MPAKLAVPETMLDSSSTFVANEELPLTVVAGDNGDVQTAESAERRQSTATVLQAGGWIACSTALGMAETLGVSPRGIGKLLNHIDIRVRAYQWGCFE